MENDHEKQNLLRLSFYGGPIGALLPFVIFVGGVIAVALSGAPDERGFWPILLLAIGIGLILARDKESFSRAIIYGMSREIVMIMITAWMLASVIGVLMSISGLVEALTWVSAQLNLSGPSFVVAVFLICCVLSLSTGSSFATILICGPILYPAGGMSGAPLPVLAGAIIAGATFGDFIAPISDTTIASVLSQKAPIGAAVKSRIKYVLPVLLISAIAYYVVSILGFDGTSQHVTALEGDPAGMPMVLIPVLIIVMFLRGSHLLVGLMTGLIFGILLALLLDLISIEQIFSVDKINFTSSSFVIDGINRAVGISFFTILLMGLVETLNRSGLIERLVSFASGRSHNMRQSESWIAGVVGAAVLLTTHSIVAILMVSDFANKTGEQSGVRAIRRSNILSMTVCVFPFLLPYFIPVILVANTTLSGQDFGLPSVSPVQAGMFNFVSWGLLIVLFLTIFTGLGRRSDQTAEKDL